MKPKRNKARILFIDDETRILRSLRVLFRDQEVYCTTDPEEAYQFLKDKNLDVIVCDQRMPLIKGTDILSKAKTLSPRTMRILLTGYSDLNAVIGSVNEGEVFRYVNKPWNNTALRKTVFIAAKISRSVPQLKKISDKPEKVHAPEIGILIIEEDPQVQQRLREILATDFQLNFAKTIDKAIQTIEQKEIGVVISETGADHGGVESLIKILKHSRPEISTVVITEKANAQIAIDLINEGQIYRLLLKPVRPGSCVLSVKSALLRYQSIKIDPASLHRLHVEINPETESKVAPGLLARIRALPSRLAKAAKFAPFN